MIYQEAFGVRRCQCVHRPRHPAIWVRLATGERAAEDDLPVVTP